MSFQHAEDTLNNDIRAHMLKLNISLRKNWETVLLTSIFAIKPQCSRRIALCIIRLNTQAFPSINSLIRRVNTGKEV